MNEKDKKPINRINFKIDSKIDNLKIGDSHLGGVPDVDTSFVWPVYKNKVGDERPYSFIGQFNFEQIKPYDREDKLPSKGLLLVFFNRYSIEETHKDNTYLPILIYIEDTSSLKRYEGNYLDKQIIKVNYSHLVFFNNLSYFFDTSDEKINKLNRYLDWEDCQEDCHDCYLLGYESNMIFRQEIHKPLIQLIQFEDYDGLTGISKFFCDSEEHSCHIYIKEENLKNKDFSNIEFEVIYFA